MNAFWWAVMAALVWGMAPILEKIGLRGASPLGGLFYRCVGVVLGLFVLSIFMVKPQEIRAIDVRSALFLVAGGFLASFIAQICFYNALKLGQVSRVVPVSASYPFIAALLGVLLLGESPNAFKLGGMIFIIIGVWLLKLG